MLSCHFRQGLERTQYQVATKEIRSVHTQPRLWRDGSGTRPDHLELAPTCLTDHRSTLHMMIREHLELIIAQYHLAPFELREHRFSTQCACPLDYVLPQ